VLGPLVRGTISNALEGGGGGATLTGPVVRGERSTVERHLSALKQRDASLVSPFLAGTRAILAAARASDRIDDAAVDEWTDFLGDERWS
ncbi:MAG TPA: DUF2520 domain-containing protein, partial [Actinomycetota bacterium]|nr:DUF2520 domain-containing protein [Actinomycetota bacterium]